MCLKRNNTKSQNTKQKRHTKEIKGTTIKMNTPYWDTTKTTNNKIKGKTREILVQPPPWMNLNTIKKIMIRYVVKNSWVPFFQNDPKSGQSNNLKASACSFWMHARKKQLHVTTNIRSNNYWDAQPTMNEILNTIKSVTLQK